MTQSHNSSSHFGGKKKIPIEFRSLFIIDSIAMDAFLNRSYSCAACSKSFSTIKSLSDHEAQAHGERPCHLCGGGKKFKNWKLLSAHLKDAHNWRRKKAEDGTIEWVYDSEPKKCEYCRKQLNTCKSFQQHVLRFHVRPQAVAGTSTRPPTKVARTDGMTCC